MSGTSARRRPRRARVVPLDPNAAALVLDPQDPMQAAASTVEALMHSLRERGTAALTEPDTQRRLSTLSEEQLHEVGARLRRLEPEIARPWSADEIEQLTVTWITCHA